MKILFTFKVFIIHLLPLFMLKKIFCVTLLVVHLDVSIDIIYLTQYTFILYILFILFLFMVIL